MTITFRETYKYGTQTRTASLADFHQLIGASIDKLAVGMTYSSEGSTFTVLSLNYA